MKKLILASISALALLGVAACSDSGTDNSTTQSTDQQGTQQPMQPATPEATPPADNNTQSTPDANQPAQ